jgi:hypothetical protein
VNCAVCKGKLQCGRTKCPLVEKFRFLRSVNIGKHIEDPTPPSVFVGRLGYPKVYAGPLVAINVDPVYADSPWAWKSIEEAIKLRVSLLRASRAVRVDEVRDPGSYLLNIQEAAASIKPIEIEAEVERLSRKAEFDDVIQPMGYSAIVDKLKIAENPKIPAKVEKVYYDDIKASEALSMLFKDGFSTYYLQKILSAGVIGLREKRKLVPTRWSITATHSILGEELKKEILNYESVNDHLLFSYEHFGNHFEIILSPGNYSFQLFELWMKKSFWSPKKTWIGYDSEDARRKKDYSELGGGYYAARLPVLEYLSSIKRQASILIIREIKPEYYAPLGVWVVEEGVRKAMKERAEVFSSFEEAIQRAKSRIMTDERLWESRISRESQKTLFDFL